VNASEHRVLLLLDWCGYEVSSTRSIDPALLDDSGNIGPVPDLLEE
jgi:hypothetical protein